MIIIRSKIETAIEYVHAKYAFSDWEQSIVYLIRFQTEIFKKYLYFRKKSTFIRTRFGQNQHLWRHYGDMMSPENHGVFQLLKEVTWGIVPGLKLLLFSSPKRFCSWVFQRVPVTNSEALQWSDVRLISAGIAIQTAIAFRMNLNFTVLIHEP